MLTGLPFCLTIEVVDKGEVKMDAEKKYYQTKKKRICDSIADALMDLAILHLQEQGLPVTEEAITDLAAEYATKPMVEVMKDMINQ